MIKWLKKDRSDKLDDNLKKDESSNNLEKSGFFNRFKQGLVKTRTQLGEGVERILYGKKEIDADLLAELETLLISSDVGVAVTNDIIKKITDLSSRKSLGDQSEIINVLKQEFESLLQVDDKLLSAQEIRSKRPFVILMVGVNGAGKTTTIGKLAKLYQDKGLKVMFAAGDTFRAAAVEQLQTLGKRHDVSVIAQHTGADSASVLFDAYNAAAARNIDVLIADTAGRLHTQSHLMDELKKIKRVLQKANPQAPHEIMLVLDASIGQNALNQARVFHEQIGVSGITMTKLDGSAKGGILFAIANELHIPFRFVGLGEGAEDLKPFNAKEFVQAIFSDIKENS